MSHTILSHTITSHTTLLRGRRGTYGTMVLGGRRGTNSHRPSFGAAQTHIYRRFAWQAGVALMVLWYSVAGVAQTHIDRRLARHKLTSTVVLPGRRSTNSHRPSFGVAGVALMALGGALGPGLVARDAAALCVAGVALCVAGVALGDIHLRFTWQACHKLASTVVLRGRRGTYGIGWRAWARFSRA